MDESFQEKSQEVQVLGEILTVAGVPLTWLIVVSGLALPLAMTVAWYVGLAWGCITTFGLYVLHKDDPQALTIWVDRVRSRVRVWRAGTKSKINILTY